MRELFFRLFGVCDIEVVEKHKSITNEKIEKLKSEISTVKKRLKTVERKLKSLRELLLNEEWARELFIQDGHDPLSKCDICKGRELGINDYRKKTIEKYFSIYQNDDYPQMEGMGV